MRPGPIGKNQRGGGYSNEKAAQFIVNELYPRSNLVINEIKLASMLVTQIQRCIFRMKGPGIMDDDHAYAKHKAPDFANAIFTMAPAGCWHYIGNEFGSDNIADQDQWTLECIDRGAELMFTAKRPFIPLVHNNFTQHFLQRLNGWKQCKRSIEAAFKMGGGIGTHVYASGTVKKELNRGHNGFDAIDYIRQLYGGEIPIIITELNIIKDDDPYAGPKSFMSADQCADEIEAAMQVLRPYNVDVLIFGEFEPNTEWEPFNTRQDPNDQWALDFNRRMAEFNRRNPVADYGSRTVGGTIELINGASGVNLREFPVSGTVITTLRGGEQLDAYYPKSDAGWWQVEYRGKLGYASANFVKIVATAPPVVDELPPFPSSKVEAENWREVFKGVEVVGQKGAELWQNWIDSVDRLNITN